MVVDQIVSVLGSPYLREVAGLVVISLVAIFFRDAIRWAVRTAVSKARTAVFGPPAYAPEDKAVPTAWIAHGIDPVKDRLDDHAWLFTPSDSPHPSKVYHRIDTVEYDGSVLHDLDEQGHKLIDLIDEYNDRIEEYREKRSALKKQLQTHFYEHDDHLLRFGSAIRNDNHAEKAAEAVLIAGNPKRSVGWLGDNEDIVQAVTPTIRVKPQFADEFSELDDITEDIEQHRSDIAERLDAIRAELADTYDVTETEIDQAKQAD